MKIFSNNIEEFIDKRPCSYDRLDFISMDRTSLRLKQGVDVCITLYSSINHNFLNMILYNTLNTSVNAMDSLWGLNIEINDIRSLQQEGARYQITEIEGDRFSFLCSDFCFFIDDVAATYESFQEMIHCPPLP